MNSRVIHPRRVVGVGLAEMINEQEGNTCPAPPPPCMLLVGIDVNLPVRGKPLARTLTLNVFTLIVAFLRACLSLLHALI